MPSCLLPRPNPLTTFPCWKKGNTAIRKNTPEKGIPCDDITGGLDICCKYGHRKMAGKFGSFVSVGLNSRACYFRRKLINIYPVLIQVHSYRHTLPPTSLPDTITPNAAKEFVIGLDDNTRFILLQELQTQSCCRTDTHKLNGNLTCHEI